MEKFNFIRTKDDETKNRLLKEGFVLFKEDGNFATFINDVTKLNFNIVDKNKIQYTNMLYM